MAMFPELFGEEPVIVVGTPASLNPMWFVILSTAVNTIFDVLAVCNVAKGARAM
jgi:hypothetical protein